MQPHLDKFLLHYGDKQIKVNQIERFCAENNLSVSVLRFEPTISKNFEVLPFATYNIDKVKSRRDLITIGCLKKQQKEFIRDSKAEFNFFLIKNLTRLLEQVKQNNLGKEQSRLQSVGRKFLCHLCLTRYDHLYDF